MKRGRKPNEKGRNYNFNQLGRSAAEEAPCERVVVMNPRISPSALREIQTFVLCE